MKDKYEINYNAFVKAIKDNVFGYDKIKNDTIKAQYYELVDTFKKANEVSYKMFSELLGEKENEEFEKMIDVNSTKELIEEVIVEYVKKTYEKKSYGADGVCLRENLLGCAIHMKYNIELLGFVSDLIEGDSRFIFVDFGDKCGAVKIDIDEIIVAERYSS